MDGTLLGVWLEQARAQRKTSSDQPGLEVSLLAAHQLGQTRAWVLAHPETALSGPLCRSLDDLLAQLLDGVPLPYLTHTQEFYGLKFAVSPEVLIPRPETELLVEQAIGWLQSHPGRRRAADVGTGSGCIAVTLAHHILDLQVCASDISLNALRLAAQNAAARAVRARIQPVQSDLLTSMAGLFDLVCANLPYIPSDTLAGLEVARHEPSLALDGGADGLDAICRLLDDAPRWLAPGGLLLLEIEARQGHATVALAHRTFPHSQVTLLRDLADLDRVVKIQTL